MNIVNKSSSVTLEPGEYKLFTSKKMESVISGTNPIRKTQITVFPNPVLDWLQINTEQNIDKIEVFDQAGVKMTGISNPDKSNILSVSGLSRGIYLLRVQVGEKVMTGKFVKL